MNLMELARAGRSPELPLTVTLPAGELTLRQWLRVLPGQRYVGKAEWQGREVLAKLLVGSKAERHYDRERRGARLLAEQGMTTPALIAEGFAAGQGGWLLFDYLAGAQSLERAWRDVEWQPMLSDAQQSVLGEALGAIARLHARGSGRATFIWTICCAMTGSCTSSMAAVCRRRPRAAHARQGAGKPRRILRPVARQPRAPY